MIERQKSCAGQVARPWRGLASVAAGIVAHIAAGALLSSVARAQATWFVNALASPGGSGASWSQAFDDLHAALSPAQPGDSIWVAKGRYVPQNNAATPRASSFEIPGDVNVFGGFDGTETSLSQRAGAFGRTLLDGDIGVLGDRSDNCFHVVTMRGGSAPSASLVDGFVICNGNAHGAADARGGGVCVELGVGNTVGPSLTLANCTVRDNLAEYGAAISSASLVKLQLKNLRVVGNHASNGGGGLYLQTSMLTCVNVEWIANSAHGDGGGALFFTSTVAGQTLIQNNLFRDNRASLGGAVKLHATALTKGDAHFENCTFAFNAAAQGGGIYVEQAFPPKPTLELYNSILWSNTAASHPQIRGGGQFVRVEYCDVQGGFTGSGGVNVTSVDPQFRSLAGRDLRLSPGSPAADAGKTALIGPDRLDLDGDAVLTERLPLDLDQRPRFADDPATPDTGAAAPGQATVDLGAYES